ncbi:MAG TPA: F0F1 ATP synthase subunit B [Gemmataceae bacterium]|nr:F0F1 ATP synthase subunit B [Gemmataceae bacterium]
MQHGWMTIVVVLIAVVLTGPAAGLTPAGPVSAEKEEGHAKGETKPHIFTPVRIDLFIWTLLVFLLLLFILKRFAWGPILEGLHKREEAIRSAIEEAKEARKETERVRAQFQREMEEAFAKIPAMMDEARRDAQRLAEEMRAKAAAEIQADRQRLRREIELARDQALQEIWNRAVELATLISAKAIRRNISEEDHRRLVDEALAELRHAAPKNGQKIGRG